MVGKQVQLSGTRRTEEHPTNEKNGKSLAKLDKKNPPVKRPPIAENVDFHEHEEIARELIIAEYNSLTGELNNRQNIRYQMMQLSVVALAALLTVSSAGIQNHLDFLIFVYPVLVLVLSIIYLLNAFEGRRIKTYIETRIEVLLPIVDNERIGWYAYRSASKIEHTGFGTIGNIGAKFIFVLTAVFAVAMGSQIMRPDDELSELLLKVAIGVTIALIVLLVGEGRLYKWASERLWIGAPTTNVEEAVGV